MSREKLLYIINHIDWFWSHRVSLAKAAHHAGYDVHVAVDGAENDHKFKESNFNPHNIPLYCGALSVINIIFALRSLILAETPSIIHAITLKYAFFTGLSSLFMPEIKKIYTIAGLGYAFSGEGIKPKILRLLISPILKLIFGQKNTHLIFQNPDDMNLMIGRGFASAQQSHLIRGSGVDLNDYTFSEEPEASSPKVLMPTRLVKEKGVRVFIEAANILRGKNVQAKFLIAGGISHSNPNAISEEEMREYLNGSNVEWLGRVSDMPALYKDVQLIAYPSYYREGVPKVLLEAAASGRAIITTDHPGCREAVEGGETGLLVPVKDAKALAGAIQELLENADLRRKMGKKAHEFAAKNYDVTLVNEKTLLVYGTRPIL